MQYMRSGNAAGFNGAPVAGAASPPFVAPPFASQPGAGSHNGGALSPAGLSYAVDMEAGGGAIGHGAVSSGGVHSAPQTPLAEPLPTAAQRRGRLDFAAATAAIQQQQQSSHGNSNVRASQLRYIPGHSDAEWGRTPPRSLPSSSSLSLWARARAWTRLNARALGKALRHTRIKRVLLLTATLAALVVLHWRISSIGNGNVDEGSAASVGRLKPSPAQLHTTDDPTLWRTDADDAADEGDETQSAAAAWAARRSAASNRSATFILPRWGGGEGVGAAEPVDAELPSSFPNPIYRLPRPSPEAVQAAMAQRERDAQPAREGVLSSLAAAAAAAGSASGISAGNDSVGNGIAPPSSPSISAQLPLTIFSTMRDLTFAAQRAFPATYLKNWNALRSWRRLGMPSSLAQQAGCTTAAGAAKYAPGWTPPVQVILFVDHGPETCAHLQKEKLLDMRGLTCVTIPSMCASSEFKKPFMHCLWNHALAHSSTAHVAFVNGDIVLLQDYYAAVQSVARALPRFVMVARRTDVPPMDWPRAKLSYFVNVITADDGDDEPHEDGGGDKRPTDARSRQGGGVTGKPGSRSLVYENPYHDSSWLRAYEQHVRLRGRRHDAFGIDTFTFHRAVLERLEFPPFLVGVYRWDNWLLAELLLRSAHSPWERTHGVRFDYASSSRVHGGGAHLNETFLPHHQRPHDGSDASSSPSTSNSFLVVDATHALMLIHDSVRSDHLRDPGALYSDELVKRRSGIRYKLGRIDNADLVLRVAHDHPVAASNGGGSGSSDEDTIPAPPLHPHRVCGENGASCFLEWNAGSSAASSVHSGRSSSSNANDRLELHLVRQASPEGVVAVLTVSAPFLPLLRNFACWAWQRAANGAALRHAIVLAADAASYRAVEEWNLDVPVFLFPNATDIGATNTPTASAAGNEDTSSASSAAFAAWRLNFLSRILDHGFSFLLSEVDSMWLENPLPALQHFEDAFRAQLAQKIMQTQRTTSTDLATAATSPDEEAAPASQDEWQTLVPACTMLGVTKRVRVRTASSASASARAAAAMAAAAAAAEEREDPNNGGSDAPLVNDDGEEEKPMAGEPTVRSSPGAPSSVGAEEARFDEVLSGSLLLVHPNKYSRYLWSKVAVCVAHVHATYPSIVRGAHQREPCRYVEERCLHDLVVSMHAELRALDFQTCHLPRQFAIDQSDWRARSQMPAPTVTIAGDGATGSSRGINGQQQQDFSQQTVDAIDRVVAHWSWSNDPTSDSELSVLRLWAQAAAAASPPAAVQVAGLLRLPPLQEVLGLSARSGQPYMFPKLLHDGSIGGAARVPAAVERWKAAGLWCAFKPELVRTATLEAEASNRMPLSVPGAAAVLSSSSPLNPSGGVLLRIYLHVSPSAAFTARRFRAWLMHLADTSVLPEEDTIDVELDLSAFRTPAQLDRDRRRTRILDSVAATEEAQQQNVAAAAGDEDSEESVAAAAAASAELSIPDPDDRSLTLSGVLSVFHAWNWKHGMKHVVSATASAEAAAEAAATEASAADAAARTSRSAGVGAAGAGARTSPSPLGADLTHEQVAAQTRQTPLRLHFRGAEWVVRYTYQERVSHATVGASSGASPSSSPAGAADVPILLLTPSVRLAPHWFLFLKRQLQAWPKRHDDPSGVERRWFGLQLLPLVSRVGDMEPRLQSGSGSSDDAAAAEALAAAPYPPLGALDVRLPRPSAEVGGEQGVLASASTVVTDELLRLQGDEAAVALATRQRLRARGDPVPGWVYSPVQRTQMLNPLGLVIFSSSIHHFNVWREAQQAQAQAQAAAFSAGAGGGVGSSAPLLSSAQPCWRRAGALSSNSPSSATHMAALLRYVFATGSFVTAPAVAALDPADPKGRARLARDMEPAVGDDWALLLHEQHEAEQTAAGWAQKHELQQDEQDADAHADAVAGADAVAEPDTEGALRPVGASLAADDALDVRELVLPAALAHVPLLDLSGASVPLPDTLPYRALLLRAAYASETSATTTPSQDQQPTTAAAGAAPSTPSITWSTTARCPWPAMHPKLASTFFVKLD